MQQHLTVEPKQPTILSAQNVVHLPGYELWMNYIENVLVLPARLELTKFAEALAETLRFYPHAAGQLHRKGDQWEIILSDAGVPIEVEDGHAARIDIEGSWVLQENLRPFLPRRGSANPFAPGATTAAGQPKLVLFKLSFSETETAVGIAWHHVLGDAIVLHKFMRSLSQQYQGHDSRDLPTPTFDKRTFPPPTGSLVERYAPLIPHLIETYSVTDVSKRYAELNAHTSPIRFKITLAQLTKLKDKVSNRLDPTSVKLTSQDILTAYVVSVLNRCSDVPITTITNAASYRHVSEVLASPDVAGNAIYVIPATLPRTPLPMAQTAMAIRRSVQSSRERTFVEEYMAAASALMQEAVNNNRTWFFSPRPGKLTVNSNASIDWRSAHFGYPTTSRFHTSGFNDRYLRVFRSNPEPSMTTALGTEDLSNQSLDVFFSIADTLKEKVGSLIQSELNGHDFPDNIPDA